MLKVLEEFWRKYKKIILILIFIILGIFLLNFIFVFTDCIAGKGFNWKAIIYSPISNEEWLSFIGNGIVGLATLLLFWIAKKSLEHERKKVRYEDESKKLKKEREIVEEYLSAFDIDSLYNLGILGASSSKEFYNTKEIENYIYNEKEKKEKELNSLIIKTNFNTNFKILLKKEFQLKDEKEKKCNDGLRNLYEMYLEISNRVIAKIIKEVYSKNFKEGKKGIYVDTCVKREELKCFDKIYSKYEKLFNERQKELCLNEIEEGEYKLAFKMCLHYIMADLLKYFDKKKEKIESNFKSTCYLSKLVEKINVNKSRL